MARILVCGGRNLEPELWVLAWLRKYLQPEDVVIHGGARGADSIAGDFATGMGCEVLVFPAEWGKHGYAAGPIRNQQMIDEGKPDLVLAFPGGRGTADMVRRAEAAKIKVIRAQKEDS